MKSQSISPLVENLGEFAIDQIISDDYALLKDFPMLNSVINTALLYKSVRDRMFMKKLERFLKNMSSVEPSTKEKIRAFAKKSSADKVSEMVISVIDNSLSHEKPEILASVFLALVDSKVSTKDFEVIVEAIDRAYTTELISFLDAHIDIAMRDIHSLKRMNISSLIYTPLLTRVEPRRTEMKTTRVATGLVDLYSISRVGSEFFDAYHYGLSLRNTSG
ncbi:TPA: hypothetical protein NKX25_000441 [Vibrio parahaemolyticus]|uniref:hypothetical protein n=1 Tax=Vibrio parahaemolyticus TaxID=670 RepID=UPI00111F40DE|nr:hypothetical protein [Vibrio parahaemolyticus]MDF4725807.1 hypothetical protein [Vibrio parahaemolyticus]MDF4952561.1 hypothetical protein [Vibrio parahaemolyticus]TOE49100.1 hypothetical protein CGJ42_15440 [Vibrio parahaemolyticus]HCE1548618.1 hypothetical protein [Vibrio parahaemolyticus]HCH4677474.1 hypothetical protein [Vibrio parahaemolyticus]